MNMPIFAETAALELQNVQALEILSADYSYAQYRVAMFAELQVCVTDHRADSVLAVHELLANGDEKQFARSFNRPAFVLVSQAGERGLMIDLYEAYDDLPIHTIWIGLCGENELPIHSYVLYHYEPLSRDLQAFLAIYQNDPEEFLMPARVPEFARR